MRPWEHLDDAVAPDGSRVELLRRAHEYLIRVDGYDLMSNEDESSARSLAELGCRGLAERHDVRVLIGGLGMGYTLRAALDALGPRALVEVAELIDVLVAWNRGPLADLAGAPLTDRRATVWTGDVFERIASSKAQWDAILLDVDNGPDALAHADNARLYETDGIHAARRALRPQGLLGAWSFSDDRGFTRRLERAGFEVRVERVEGSRKGRGRFHYIWLARPKPAPTGARRNPGRPHRRQRP